MMNVSEFVLLIFIYRLWYDLSFLSVCILRIFALGFSFVCPEVNIAEGPQAMYKRRLGYDNRFIC